jgi:peptide/nickel transport system substrate-binding protein
MLVEAGFSGGVDVEAKVINRPSDVKPLEVLQAMWSQAGIRLKITGMDRLPWIDDGRAGKFELLSHGWRQRADPHLIQATRTGATNNWGGYSNPDVDKYWEEAEKEYDQAKRQEIYKKLQMVLYEQCYQFVGYQYPQVAAINAKVKNLTGWWNYRYMWID